MTSEKLQVDGTDINVSIWNPRLEPTATIIAAHGFGSSGRQTFNRVGPELTRQSVRLVAPDLPGFGLSDKRDAYSLKLYSEVIFTIASRFSSPVNLVVGHSFGAKVVLASLVDYPTLFTGFSLTNPGGFSGALEQLIRLGDVEPVKSLLNHRWFETLAKATPLREMIRYEPFRSAVREISGSYSRLDLGYAGYAERLLDIQLPGQLVWGESDPVLSASVIGRVQATFPDICYSPIADAGHVPMKTRPADYVKAISTFIDTLSIPR